MFKLGWRCILIFLLSWIVEMGIALYRIPVLLFFVQSALLMTLLTLFGAYLDKKAEKKNQPIKIKYLGQ